MKRITLCNPTAFDDIEKLKQAVLDSNEQVIAAIATLEKAHRNVLEMLAMLVVENEKGNIGGLQRMLKDIGFAREHTKQPTKH